MTALDMPGRGRAGAAIVVTFEDIQLGPDGTANVFGVYRPPGSDFFLTGDFQARGAGASFALTPETQPGSGEVSTSLAPFGGSPTTLTNESGLPFSLLSIDLARENLFNNPTNNGIQYPVVSFAGLKADGTDGHADLQRQSGGLLLPDLLVRGVHGPDRGELDSAALLPSPGSAGLHQFDNIVVD